MTGKQEEIGRVLGRARRLVVPDRVAEAELKKVTEKVRSRVEAAVEGKPEITGVLLGGSAAKGTWLPPRDNVDIDLFVGFSPEVETSRFEELGLKVGKEAVRGYKHGKKYAQHPYTEAVVDGFRVNIVPYYIVGRGGPWRSAADRSVHHVNFVRENLDDEARLQVRLLKRFMRTVGVYGAEIEKEGFSGYAAEVLIHEHKTLEGVLRWFAVFRPGVGDGEGRSEAQRQQGQQQKKKGQEQEERGGKARTTTAERPYFMLIDPVDSTRDLGKAISRETVARMVLASRAFLEKPRIEFFTKLKRVERRHLVGDVYAVIFKHMELSEDTLWGELKRSARQIAKHVEDEGFKLARFGAASDRERSSAIILLAEVHELPRFEERVGPGVEIAEGAKRFTGMNHSRAELVWVGEDGRLRLLRERRFTKLSELLKELLGPGVGRVGASKEVADAIKRNGRIVHGEGPLMKEMARHAWLREGLSVLICDDVGTT